MTLAAHDIKNGAAENIPPRKASRLPSRNARSHVHLAGRLIPHVNMSSGRGGEKR